MDTKIRTLLDKKGHEVFAIQYDQTVYEAIAVMDAITLAAWSSRTETRWSGSSPSEIIRER